jgi:hypothetical protein
LSQQINLFNPLFMRKEKYFSARTMLQSLGLIALGLLLLYGYALVQTRGLERTAVDYRQQLSTQREQFVRLGAKGRSKLLDAEVARLEADADARRGMLELIRGGDLGDTVGFSRYLEAFARHSVQGVWLTGFNVGERGNVLTIRGRVLHADLVPAYLKALNDDPVMRGRQVTEMKLTARDDSSAGRSGGAGAAAGPARYVEFELMAPLKAGAPGKGEGKPLAQGGRR